MPTKITETITAFGHPNVQAIHPTTLMITKDKHISKNGDCIVAVAADKALSDLSTKLKDALRQPNAKLTITLEAGNEKQQIHTSGSPDLLLTHPTDIVVRKSDFVSDRTLAVKADKASNDLDRGFVEKLKDASQTIKITLEVA